MMASMKKKGMKKRAASPKRMLLSVLQATEKRSSQLTTLQDNQVFNGLNWLQLGSIRRRERERDRRRLLNGKKKTSGARLKSFVYPFTSFDKERRSSKPRPPHKEFNKATESPSALIAIMELL